MGPQILKKVLNAIVGTHAVIPVPAIYSPQPGQAAADLFLVPVAFGNGKPHKFSETVTHKALAFFYAVDRKPSFTQHLIQ
jgi:hypothetical protein